MEGVWSWVWSKSYALHNQVSGHLFLQPPYGRWRGRVRKGWKRGEMEIRRGVGGASQETGAYRRA